MTRDRPHPAERRPLDPISALDITDARRSIAQAVRSTPLVALPSANPGSNRTVWAKLECLQSIGSFKIRGAVHALATASDAMLSHGAYTASAGNMAQGVAWAARARGVACRVVIPDSAPRAKVDAIVRLGGVPVPVPFADWWEAVRTHGHPGERGLFIHPVADPRVIAGNGTVGLELLDALPDLDTVVVPWGGGGLACGIAAAVKAHRPEVRVLAAEVETSAPLAASLSAGRPVDVDRRPSFVDGIGGKGVLTEMWPLATSLIDGSIVVSLEEVCEAIRVLARDARVIAEGAGGAALAAASRDDIGGRRVVAVVSGGNIDPGPLAAILRGEVPGPNA